MEAKINPENYATDASASEPAAEAGAVKSETTDMAMVAQQEITAAAPTAPPLASEIAPLAGDHLPEAKQAEPPAALNVAEPLTGLNLPEPGGQLQESATGLEAQAAQAPDSHESAEAAALTSAPPEKPLVIEHLERFEAQLAEHLRNSASCSRAAFDYLYNEMQAYKKNFLREAQHPLLLDLMMLYDSIDKLRRNYEQAVSVDALTLSQNLDALQVEAEEILGRVGIERMSATPDRLDVNLQRAVKTVPTDDPTEHLLVIEQVRSGFVSGEQTWRKEQVIVKKYTSPAPSPGTTAV